jgi:hypothetical protein
VFRQDTTGTLYSMVKFAGLRDPITLDFENSTIAYCVDAFSISMGALVGTSPVTAFIESATGIAGMYISYSRYSPRSDSARRGRQDWHHRNRHRTALLRLYLLRAHLRIHPTLGYRRRSCHCWLAHDSQRTRYKLGLCR